MLPPTSFGRKIMKKLLLMSTILAGMFSMQAQATVYDTYAALLGTNTVLSIGDQTVTVTGASLTQNLNRILANQPGINETAAMNRAIGHQMWRVARHQLDTRDRAIVNDLAMQTRTIASDVADAFNDDGAGAGTSFGGVGAGDPADTWSPWRYRDRIFYREPETHVDSAPMGNWVIISDTGPEYEFVTQQNFINRTITFGGTFWIYTDARSVVVNGERDATPPVGEFTRERRVVIDPPGFTAIDRRTITRTIANHRFDATLPADEWTGWAQYRGINHKHTNVGFRREVRREGNFDVTYGVSGAIYSRTTFRRTRIVNGGHDGGPDHEFRYEDVQTREARTVEQFRVRVFEELPTSNTGVGVRDYSFTDIANFHEGLSARPWITTDVANAWRDGWTGDGVNVGIVDLWTGDVHRGLSHGEIVKGIAVGTRANPGIAPGATAYEINANNGAPTATNRPEILLFNHSYTINTRVGDFYDGDKAPSTDWDYANARLIVGGNFAARYKNKRYLNIYGADNESFNCSNAGACNLVAVQSTAVGDATVTDGPDGLVYNYTRDPNNTTIVVGAIQSNNQLVGYSNRAGILKDDFIVVEPYVGQYGRHGTSTAAPRVTGAAALIMQKFNTSPINTKRILLGTADDLGAPGVDDVFGHGKLNIAAALSPVGRIR